MKRLLNMFVMLLVLMLAAQGTAFAAGKVESDNIGTSIGPDYSGISIGLETQELYKVETYYTNEGTLKVTTKDAATGKALGSVKVDIVLVKKTKSGTKYETVKSVKTDSKGNKSVKVKPGSYEIRVKKVPSGYYAEGTGKATVKGGKSASASIKINPLFTCKITVLSDKKKPISGATVKATNGEVTVTAKTNSKGVATLKNVKYGKNSIKITKKNKNVDVNYSKKLKLEGKSKKTLSKTVSVPKKNIQSLVTETQLVVTKEPAYYHSAPDEPADHQEPLSGQAQPASGQEEPPTTYEEPAILIEPTDEEYTITHTTETVEIPFKTVYVDAPGWLLGEEAVGQEGRNGEKVITYEIKTDKNGTEVSRRAISESITKNVINKEIYRGTFVPVVTYQTESLPCLPGLDESKRSSSLDAACASWAMSMAKNDKVAHSNHDWGESVGAWGSIEGVLYGRNYTVISTQNGQTYSGNVSLASHGGEMLATGSEWGAGCVARTESQPDGTYVTIYYACARSN